jgi:O-antigen/teichoic acid export membrane protein
MRARAGADNVSGDLVTLFSGVSQNVLGIVVAALAMFAVQVLMTRALGPDGFGVVTVLTQAAFVASFLTRGGMDMAVLRDVAVDAGTERLDRVRVPVARAALIAVALSAAAALAVVALGDTVLVALSLPIESNRAPLAAAALALPFLALANVWLAATRGLKIMRYTLYVFWAGQNLGWIVLTVLLWAFSTSATSSVLAYSLSWLGAAAAAGYFWRRESRGWVATPPRPGWFSALMRYAGPRAPAALFAQLLFWTDLFVVTRFVGQTEIGIYAAALRAGQVVVVFLASVNLMFGPFVADLHNRGRTRHLDRLYKTVTRWLVAATLPAFLLIAVAPEAVLAIFGPDFTAGRAALLILIAGQLANVVTGSAGFILIMVGRTGYDLAIYTVSILLDLGLALWLCPRYGIEGAAIASAVTFTASNAARLLLVRVFVGIQPYDRHYLRLLAPAASGAIAMWVAHALTGGGLLDVVVTGALGTLAYGASFLAVGATPEERAGVRALLSRFRAGGPPRS